MLKNDDTNLNIWTRDIPSSSWLPLNNTETVEAWTHPSLVMSAPRFLVSVGVILASLLAPVYVTLPWQAPVSGVIVGILLLLASYVKYVSTVYVFTNNRVLVKRGAIRTNTRDAEYEDIENVETAKTITDRIFGLGEILVVTAGQSSVEITMRHVPQMDEAYGIVNDASFEE